jgi:hypothetical protein
MTDDELRAIEGRAAIRWVRKEVLPNGIHVVYGPAGSPEDDAVQLISEVRRLRAALEPFAKTARGIPSNWQGSAVLSFEATPSGKGYRITTLPPDAGMMFPIIAHYRNAARAALDRPEAGT